MVLAYLRNPDFIKPNYEHGTKSRLREELFIKTAALDFYKEMNTIKLDVLQTYLKVSSGDGRNELLDQIMDSIERIEGTYSFNFNKTKESRTNSSREKLAKAFELLEKKGLVGANAGFTTEKLHEIIEDYRTKKRNDNKRSREL